VRAVIGYALGSWLLGVLSAVLSKGRKLASLSKKKINFAHHLGRVYPWRCAEKRLGSASFHCPRVCCLQSAHSICRVIRIRDIKHKGRQVKDFTSRPSPTGRTRCASKNGSKFHQLSRLCFAGVSRPRQPLSRQIVRIGVGVIGRDVITWS